MALAQYQIIDGDSLELELTTGHSMRADRRVVGGAKESHTVTSAAGRVVFTPAVLGNYYLAVREDATKPWCRIGMLEVVSLVDSTYEGLKVELENVNALLENAETAKELIQNEITDPSGTAIKRMNISQLTRHRGVLEARLANYERAAQGRPPVRWS